MVNDAPRGEKTSPPHLVTIHPWLLESSIRPMALAVYIRLRAHYGTAQAVWHVGTKDLAKIAGVSPDTLRSALKELAAVDAVRRVPNYRADGGRVADTIHLGIGEPVGTLDAVPDEPRFQA